MAPEQHNKYLGFAHLAYAALHSLFGIFFGLMMVGIMSTISSSPRDLPPPPAVIVIMVAFLLVFTIGWCIPSMIAAYALLKQKKWAKTASIVAAVMAAAQLPIGTAVAVYTFWFVFSEAGRSLYERRDQLLPPSPDAAWLDPNQKKGMDFEHSATPPDWR